MAEQKKIPAARFVKKNSNFSAVASKLVNNRTREKTYINEAGGYNLLTQTSSLEAISKDIQESAKNTESIMSLFPDMELSMQILISSILSPKDMVGNELIYKVREDFLTPDVTGKLIQVIKDNIEDHYKLKEKLPLMLKEILFISGAYPIAVIPESDLDTIINSGTTITTESLRNHNYLTSDNEFYNIGILGNGTSVSVESIESLDTTHDFSFSPSRKEIHPETDILKYITISDNPDIFKMPLIMKKRITNLTQEALGSRFKGYNNLSSENRQLAKENPDLSTELGKIRDSLYKPSAGLTIPFVSLSGLKSSRANVGRPLILKLPAESIIPVHTPGDPDNQIGYFVLVDQHGSPLHMSEKVTALTDLDEGMMKPDNSMVSILVERAQNNIRGKNIKGLSIDNYVSIYTELVEKELLAKLESGIYGKNVELANVNEVYKIMLARTLKNQMTKLIYIPSQMVEYMRYKIHQNGVGKALSEDMRILLSLRAMMLFSRIMGSVKNSIGITEIKLKLDERDPDPQKTIQIAMNEVLRSRQQNFPIGISSPMDLVDWVQRSGIEFSFEGHPRIPDVSLEFNQRGNSNIMPDESLDEDLRKRTIMSYFLSPETVDNGFSPDFATTVVNNNLLLSKRVITIQRAILDHLKSLVLKITPADPIIMKALRGVIVDNLHDIKKSLSLETKISDELLIEFVVQEFLDILQIELPMPETVTIENQMESFDKYQEFLEKALDAWVSAEMFSVETAGDLNGKMESIKATLKSYFTRKWMTENGIMEELGDITNDLSDSSIFKLQETFMMKVIKNSTTFLTEMQAMVQAVNTDLKDYKVGGDDTIPSSTGEGGDEFGGDEFGGGEDLDAGLGEGEELDETQNLDNENAVSSDEASAAADESDQEKTNKDAAKDTLADDKVEKEDPSL